jgi:hypothetical protein
MIILPIMALSPFAAFMVWAIAHHMPTRRVPPVRIRQGL